MDVKSRLTNATKLILLLKISFLLTACGNDYKAESITPNTKQTCGGTAIQSKYIVHYLSGKWDFVENHDRNNFKETYVKPNLEKIDFIEYDQKISPFQNSGSETRQDGLQTAPLNSVGTTSPTLLPSSGIDNWGIGAINAPAAWQKNYRGQNIIVAVIDSGVDITHAQLQSQIAFNAGESGTLQNNGIDDDGNGLIDDYAGYSFFDDTNDVTDSVGHGTHVSGIIAAQHSDSELKTGYTQGVAPEAKILPVKFLGPDGGGTLTGALKGIDYAIARGAKIISASWGGPGCSQSLRQKVTEAVTHDVLFVAAAGNSGSNLDLYPEYPAAFNLPLQITVGAIRSSLNMDSYSNYSPSLVQLFAPGTQIVSTVPGNGYAAMSGTSMATPFVSGAAAVILSAQPNLTLTQVRAAILKSTSPGQNYVNASGGRLNLGAAINAIGR